MPEANPGTADRAASTSVSAVWARTAENTVVFGDGGTHAKVMEEPGTERSEEGRLKIVVEERQRIRLFVAAEEFAEGLAAKVMNHAGGEVNVAGMFAGEGVTLDEVTVQPFG